ncbi:hypothetical protein ES708_11777 [subsurface metagenome]
MESDLKVSLSANLGIFERGRETENGDEGLSEVGSCALSSGGWGQTGLRVLKGFFQFGPPAHYTWVCPWLYRICGG